MIEYKYFFLAYFTVVFLYIAWRYGLPKFSIDKTDIILFGGMTIFLALGCINSNNMKCNLMPLLFLVGALFALFNYYYFRRVLRKLSPTEFIIMFVAFGFISDNINR